VIASSTISFATSVPDEQTDTKQVDPIITKSADYWEKNSRSVLSWVGLYFQEINFRTPDPKGWERFFAYNISNKRSELELLSVAGENYSVMPKGSEWMPTQSKYSIPLDILKSYFRIERENDVLQYLMANMHLIPLLLEAKEEITKYFPFSESSLELLIDPESESKREELILSILVDLPVDEALKLRNRFDQSWWGKNIKRAKGNLCITLEYK